ncbi:DUF3899 domain-containing protein [Heyndrickxia acidicola]|uniref:DUF3899 domain-containing protein n=1 Tax=Heyndrickxia acidicola TaxID=209389 RepID=A0ABU6MHI4_9BACI|nr:DUF3899 domain-containing protein [Heyndrickxia acidicola]MED1202515.1 DUF3899 domain-containing protein [Heyndrickxia acidicola]
MFKKLLFWLIPSEIVVLIVSLIKYHSVTLLHYINISFVIGGIFFFCAIFLFLAGSGFFDISHASFRKVFKSRRKEEEDEEHKPLSEILDFNFSPLLLNGCVMIAIMLLALFVYYH